VPTATRRARAAVTAPLTAHLHATRRWQVIEDLLGRFKAVVREFPPLLDGATPPHPPCAVQRNHESGRGVGGGRAATRSLHRVAGRGGRVGALGDAKRSLVAAVDRAEQRAAHQPGRAGVRAVVRVSVRTPHSGPPAGLRVRQAQGGRGTPPSTHPSAPLSARETSAPCEPSFVRQHPTRW
jgi:hypothetical protein